MKQLDIEIPKIKLPKLTLVNIDKIDRMIYDYDDSLSFIDTSE